MKRLPIYLIALFFLVSFFSCKKNKFEITNKAGELPLLLKTNNIGIIEGFNIENPPATDDSITASWEDALSAGMSAGRLQIDWPDIESDEGVYDVEMVEARFQEMFSKGLKTHLLISAYDSEGPDLPDYLEGLAFDDPKIIESFNNLMDWIIPLFTENGGYAISVANEPDNAFKENKNLVKKTLQFFEPVRDHIHTINENMGVSITMNSGNLSDSRKDMKQIMSAVDFGCFNLYGSGLFPLDKTYTTAENKEHIQEMLDFSGSKLIVIQELGLHSDDSLLNSSEEIQRDFFNTFFSVMEKEERIRAAYIFQMVDWSPATVNILNSAYEEDTPQWFIDQYGLVLETLGLIDFNTGKRKLAWGEIMNWIEKFN